MKPAVQKVLDHFGLDESDFERLDPIVDWESLARNIEKPPKTAVCHVLDKTGDFVVSEGRPARVLMEVTVANYQEELKKKSLEFVEWWD